MDPVHLVAPLPDAFVGAAEGERVALLALPQRRFDSLGLGDVGVDHDVAAARQAAVAVLQDGAVRPHALDTPLEARQQHLRARFDFLIDRAATVLTALRSEEHTSELQSLMRISYAVFCLKKKKHNKTIKTQANHTL